MSMLTKPKERAMSARNANQLFDSDNGDGEEETLLK